MGRNSRPDTVSDRCLFARTTKFSSHEECTRHVKEKSPLYTERSGSSTSNASPEKRSTEPVFRLVSPLRLLSSPSSSLTRTERPSWKPRLETREKRGTRPWLTSIKKFNEPKTI